MRVARYLQIIAPRRPPGLAGLFLSGDSLTPPRLAVLIDYQNVHLTARDTFAPVGTTPQKTLVHPLRFAEELLAARAARQGDTRQKLAVLEHVMVYRGVPSNAHEPRLYAASQAQRAEWSRDRRVGIWYRALRYPRHWPGEPAREKGVDVKLAVDLVRTAESGKFDVVVLASHDTDLEPALEAAAALGRAKIETVGWEGAKRLRIHGRRLWHTTLDAAAFVRSRDRRNYW